MPTKVREDSGIDAETAVGAGQRRPLVFDRAALEERDHWLRVLAEAPDPVAPAPDLASPGVGARRREVLPWTGGEGVAAALARVTGGSPLLALTVLVAALKICLWRTTGQRRVPVATPPRRSPEGGELAPNLVVTLDHLDPESSFKAVLLSQRETLVEAYKRQTYPFERLCLDLGVEVRDGAYPFFDVVLALEGFHGPLPVVSPALAIRVDDLGRGVSGHVDYDATRYRRDSVEVFVDHWLTLLGGALARIDEAIGRLPMAEEAELHRLVEGWNDTATDYPRQRTSVELFEEQADRSPAATALEFADLTLTYRELDRRAEAVAEELRSMGVGPGTLVALCAERCGEMIVAILGILKAGGAYVPLDPSLPRERLAFLLEDTGVPVLVVQDAVEEVLPEHGARVLRLSWVAGRERDRSEDRGGVLGAGADDLAYMVFTSGSTGRPKGVSVPHRGVVRLLRDTDYVALGPEDRIAQASVVTFDAATFEIWGALLCGGCIVEVPREVLLSPPDLARHLRECRVTTLFLTTALLHQVAREVPDAFATLDTLLFGGEAVDPKQVRKILEAGAPRRLLHVYGPTESTTYATWHLFDSVEPGALTIPIGQPIANTRAYLVDRRLEVVPVAVPGELVIAGDGLARGYHGRPALTAERFIPDPFSGERGGRLYRTGDLVRRRSGGVIEFLGRADYQIKLRGFRIELGEIEAALVACAGVSEAVVLLREEVPGDKRLVACVELVAGAPVEAEDLAAALRERLPEYMVPSGFAFLERFPMTPSGKLDRQALASRNLPVVTPGSRFVVPRTTLEKRLAALWEEVLGVERVGLYDDFFMLGGHSLLATQLVSRIRSTFHLEMPLRTLFENPTVVELGAALEPSLENAPTVAAGIERAPRGGVLPLSFSQQRLWFIDQLEPGSPAYNVAAAFRIRGALSVATLARAFSLEVRRQEALRTYFAAERGEPRQALAEPWAVLPPVVDLQGLSADARRGTLQALARHEALTPFDLSHPPLFRLALVRLGEEEHAALLTLHHIICDGWSLAVLANDLGTFYEALLADAPPRLAELPIHYADYAVWQRRTLAGDALESELEVWRQRLAGLPPALELPTDRPRPRARSPHGAAVHLSLAELSPSLLALARQEEATPFMVLLGLFQALLHHFTGELDFGVGTPIAGRTHVETEDVVGFFVNTLVLRADLHGDPTCRALIRRVREITLDAHAHQAMPFEKLVEELGGERRLDQTPLFQVMFILQNTPQGATHFAGLDLEPLAESESLTAKFDLTLKSGEAAAGFEASLVYATSLFDRATMERLGRRFTALVRSALETPEQRLSQLAVLDPVERRQLLDEWNATARPVPAPWTVPARFAARAARHPDRTAVLAPEGALTFGELEARANRLGHHLRSLGVGSETLVGLCLGRSASAIVGLLGILKAGGAYVPMDPDYPLERLAFMAEDAELGVIVTEERWRDVLPALGFVTVCLDAEEGAPGAVPWSVLPPAPPQVALDPDHVAYAIYTSGSTGRPKGTLVRHRSAVHLIEALDQAIFRTGGDAELRVGLNAPLAFDASVKQWLHLLLGHTLVVVPETARRDGRELAALLAKNPLDVLDCTPSQLAVWLEEDLAAAGASLPPTMLVGGETLDEGLWQRLATRTGTAFFNVYGPTECTVDATARRVEQGVPPSLGHPIANVRVYPLDRSLQPVPAGVYGELCIAGAGVARGYLGRPALTAERFVPDPFGGDAGARLYRTGDLGRWRIDGELEYLGRRDQQVKLRGYRIELGEIESVLSEHPAVREAVAVVKEWIPGNPQLVAYVLPSWNEGRLEQELERFAVEQLPRHMVPQVFVLLEQLPLTVHGKVDRRALPEPHRERAGGDQSFVAPRDPLEGLLATLWAEVLKLERVGIHDDFFALGGHSLLATQLVSRIRDALRFEMQVRVLFEYPTVADLASYLTRELGKGGRAQQAPPIQPVPREGRLPLSFAQQRLWFIDQLDPGSFAYNIPAAIGLDGPLDVAALGRALSEVVRRHEALRTVFPVVDDEPVQVVQPPHPLLLPVVDLSALPGEALERELRRVVLAAAGQLFVLDEGPLLRMSLVRLAQERHAAVVVKHHIVSDGWSMSVLVQEVGILYEAFSKGEPSPLPELPVQYADFAVWQRSWLAGAELERQLEYWRLKLAELPPLLDLPLDRPRPALRSPEGRVLPFAIDRELSEDLLALSRHQGVTLFMLLLAGFQAVLGRTSGRTDFALGTPIAGRTRLEIENLIGFFINTLVLRADLGGDPTFHQLLLRVRDTSLEAHAHQDLPFEKLVEELAVERSLSYTPVFQAMFVLQNTPRSATQLAGVEIHPLEISTTRHALFDLNLSVSEREQGLSGLWTYATSLFDGSTVERLGRHLVTLLRAAAVAPEERVSRLPLLEPAERHQLVAEWSVAAPPAVSDRLVHERILDSAERHPERVAVSAGGETLTYGELARRSAQLARQLRRRGVGPETPVGLSAGRSVAALVGVVGILRAGGAYLPLDPSHPRDRLTYTVEDAGLRLVVTEHRWLGLVEDLGLEAVIVESPTEDPTEEASPAAEDQRLESENLAYVIYTSGSTGRPKGTWITHRSVTHLIEALDGAIFRRRYRDGWVVGLNAPLTFDASVQGWLHLALGNTVVMIPEGARRDPRELAGLLAEQPLDLLDCTPSQLALWLEEPALDELLPRILLVGGEAVPERVWQSAAAIDSETYNVYGPTECTVDTTCGVVEAARRPHLGRPLGNARVLVLDGHRQPMPVGVYGEICIGGDGLARGYLGRPALTAERFVPDPHGREAGSRIYRTGDLGRWLAEGDLEFMGRGDRQVKLRGYRIELGEIESVLVAHPAVREAVVTLREDIPGNPRLVAYAAVHEPSSVRAELAALLEARLPEYMVPGALVLLHELPLTAHAKIDLRALPAPEVSGGSRDAGPSAPRTPVEDLLAAIWADVLSLDRVRVDDNFFALGGHSLLAARLISRVREAFAVELPLREIFQAPTIAGLARRIEEAQRRGRGVVAPPLVPQPDAESWPLSFAQERLWFLDQLDPGSIAYNLPLALTLRGDLDPVALAGAFDAVRRRHEILRTRFEMTDGVPQQLVDPPGYRPLPMVDLSRLPAESAVDESRRLVAREVSAPFDLARGPLVRLSLVRRAANDHSLVGTLHHIVSDGWSQAVLLRDFGAAYRALSNGEEPRLPPLPVQYRDYAAWQRDWLQGEVLDSEIAFWRGQLEGLPPLLDLPLDRPRPPVQGHRGDLLRFELPALLSQRLEALARSHGSTLFITLLAVFQALLKRLSGQELVAVGTPVAGRGLRQLEDLVGFFVNTLVMVADPGDDAPFVEHLRRVRERVLDSHAHQDVPFERLVEELQPQRSLGHSPLFQVMFSFVEESAGAAELPGLEVAVETSNLRVAKFDLSLSLGRGGEGLSGALEYDADLFDRTTAQRLAGLFERLAAAIVDDPQSALGSLPLFAAAERQQLLREWSFGPRMAGTPSSLEDRLRAMAKTRGSALAVTDGDERLTFDELEQRSRRLAGQLIRSGVRAEIAVGLWAERSVGVLVALVAILRAGGAFVPLDPRAPRRRLLHMIEDAGLRRVACAEPSIEAVRSLGVEAIAFDAGAGGEARPPEPPSIDPNNLAYVVYTSGSTGRPKGTLVRHGSALDLLEAVGRRLETEGLAPAVIGLNADLIFDAAVEQVLHLFAGRTLVILPEAARVDGRELLSFLERQPVDLLDCTPSQLSVWLEAPEVSVPGALPPVVLVGGEAISQDLWQRLAGLDQTTFFNAYGPTECTVDVSMALVRGECRAHIGRPLANARALVLDVSGEPVPLGVVGELYIGGPGLARGYLGQAARTATAFRPDRWSGEPGARLYRTGDLVRWSTDGRLEYVGRADRQLKIRGYRVEPGEIEQVLAEHPSVVVAAVLVRADVSGRDSLAAFLVTRGAEPPVREELLAHLGERLPEYMWPAVFVTVAEVPLTPQGKLDHRALVALSPEQGVVAPAPRSLPRDPVEAGLVALLEELLGVSDVGLEDEFFELGGHSLLAVRFLVRVEQRFGLRLPVSVLFERPTVGLLAERVRQGGGGGEEPALVTLRSGTQGVPLFLVHGAGGSAFSYLPLARSLTGERAIHGFQAEGLDGRRPPLRSVSAMAERYLGELLRIRPHGPYHLAGWSLGGLVAFEMACRLRGRGEDVLTLQLIDSAFPKASKPRLKTRRELETLAAFGLELGIPVEVLQSAAEPIAGLPREERLGALLVAAHGAGIAIPDLRSERLEQLFAVFEAGAEAARKYRPPVYGGDVVWLRASAAPKAGGDGWVQRVHGRFHTVTLDGDHHSILRSPRVAALAGALDEGLTASEPPEEPCVMERNPPEDLF